MSEPRKHTPSGQAPRTRGGTSAGPQELCLGRKLRLQARHQHQGRAGPGSEGHTRAPNARPPSLEIGEPPPTRPQGQRLSTVPRLRRHSALHAQRGRSASTASPWPVAARGWGNRAGTPLRGAGGCGT